MIPFQSENAGQSSSAASGSSGMASRQSNQNTPRSGTSIMVYQHARAVGHPYAVPFNALDAARPEQISTSDSVEQSSRQAQIQMKEYLGHITKQLPGDNSAAATSTDPSQWSLQGHARSGFRGSDGLLSPNNHSFIINSAQQQTAQPRVQTPSTSIASPFSSHAILSPVHGSHVQHGVAHYAHSSSIGYPTTGSIAPSVTSHRSSIAIPEASPALTTRSIPLRARSPNPSPAPLRGTSGEFGRNPEAKRKKRLSESPSLNETTGPARLDEDHPYFSFFNYEKYVPRTNVKKDKPQGSTPLDTASDDVLAQRFSSVLFANNPRKYWSLGHVAEHDVTKIRNSEVSWLTTVGDIPESEEKKNKREASKRETAKKSIEKVAEDAKTILSDLHLLPKQTEKPRQLKKQKIEKDLKERPQAIANWDLRYKEQFPGELIPSPVPTYRPSIHLLFQAGSLEGGRNDANSSLIRVVERCKDPEFRSLLMENLANFSTIYSNADATTLQKMIYEVAAPTKKEPGDMDGEGEKILPDAGFPAVRLTQPSRSHLNVGSSSTAPSVVNDYDISHNSGMHFSNAGLQERQQDFFQGIPTHPFSDNITRTAAFSDDIHTTLSGPTHSYNTASISEHTTDADFARMCFQEGVPLPAHGIFDMGPMTVPPVVPSVISGIEDDAEGEEGMTDLEDIYA